MGDIPNLQGPELRCRGHVDTVAGVSGVPLPPGTQDSVVSHPDPRYLPRHKLYTSAGAAAGGGAGGAGEGESYLVLVNVRDTTVEPGGALHWGADVGHQGDQAGQAGRHRHGGRRAGRGGRAGRAGRRC